MTCLDLFAGSGALGFEAASRGAEKVVLVEASPKVAEALQANARLLEAGARVEVLRQDAVKFATSTSLRFDLAFLDPPYRQGWIEKISPMLPSLLHEEGLLYAEAEAPLEACGDWRTVKRGKAGQVYFHLMQREP